MTHHLDLGLRILSVPMKALVRFPSRSSLIKLETRDVDNDKNSDVYNFAMNGLEGRNSTFNRDVDSRLQGIFESNLSE